ncbi:MAG TPA: TIM barrel protein [Mucilaginibacter sp.]|jgi:sugar phosphate isomerase/epimerase
MDRRSFVFHTSGLVATAFLSKSVAKAILSRDKMDRLAMGTLLFRYQFKETPPPNGIEIKNPLTLMDIPQHHRDRFGIRKLEFWSEHFESLDKDYLILLKDKIRSAKCELLNVQFDGAPFDKKNYDLASTDEELRQASIDHAKKWMNAASFLGSKCVRVNPGHPKSSVEKSITSFKELVPYAKSKKLTIITANHFGLETDPDKHVAVVKGAGPGLYTEPDFGNYNGAVTMYDSLAKIIPYAHIVSAKVVDFRNTADGHLEHISYDFDRCVKLAESLGFKGNYMVAQWSGKYQPEIDYNKVADWTIAHLKANIN